MTKCVIAGSVFLARTRLVNAFTFRLLFALPMIALDA